VTPGIIDPLKIIEIDLNQAKGQPLVLATCSDPFRPLNKRAATVQVGV